MKKEFLIGKVQVEFYEEWSHFFEKCNWYTFTPFCLTFENEAYLGAFEVTLTLMGFTVRVTYQYNEEPINTLKQLRDEAFKNNADKDQNI